MISPQPIASRKFPALLAVVLTVVLGAAVPGCTRAGGPLDDGLYLRTHLSSSMFLWTDLVYVSGDRIAWSAKGGVDPFDFAAAEKSDPKNIGHYKINGDQIEIAWGGGAGTANWHLEYKEGKVSAINAGGIIKAEPYPKDKHLEASFDGNIGPADATTGVLRPATLTFMKTGQFTPFSSGKVMYAGKVLREDPDVSRPGIYQLTGNTLTMRFADGATERHTVLPFNKALDPAHAKLSDEELIYDAIYLSRSR